MIEIVNVVASGDLGSELDLKALLTDLPTNDVITEYHPETHPGLHIRFEDAGPLVTVYTSGSYVIMGAKNKSQVNHLFSCLQESLEELGIQIDRQQASPVIQNIICKGDLGQELDLNTLSIILELENIEYEPEQSPFLYYWPEEYDCVISIPANGEVVITGIKTQSEAEAAFEFLETKIKSLLDDLVS